MELYIYIIFLKKIFYYFINLFHILNRYNVLPEKIINL